MVYGYCRVSSKSQENNNSFEQQEQEILSKYENAKIFKESFTGTKTDRPVLKYILECLQANDILVVTKLDRLARNTIEGIQLVQNLFEKNVSVHVLNVSLLENTSMGKFFLTTLLAVAEMERNMIIERTQVGKEIAKTKDGFQEGRPPKFTQEQLNYAVSLLKNNSYKEVERMTRMSKSTLIRAKKKNRAVDI